MVMMICCSLFIFFSTSSNNNILDLYLFTINSVILNREEEFKGRGVDLHFLHARADDYSCIDAEEAKPTYEILNPRRKKSKPWHKNGKYGGRKVR